MIIVLSNKILVLISSLSLAAGILALKFGFEGLFPIFVVVISFFFCRYQSVSAVYQSRRERCLRFLSINEYSSS